jgi:hypothetical protein
MRSPQRYELSLGTRWATIRVWLPTFFMIASVLVLNPMQAQESDQQAIAQQIRQLMDSMARAQAQIDEAQRQLSVMKEQLAALKGRTKTSAHLSDTDEDAHPASTPSNSASSAVNVIGDLSERQAIEASQIKTLDQSKVESASNYPVKISGLILFNSFINTSAVDIPATPTIAQPGPGSTGASVRQTILGVEASGPHLFGASSAQFDPVNALAEAGARVDTFTNWHAIVVVDRELITGQQPMSAEEFGTRSSRS